MFTGLPAAAAPSFNLAPGTYIGTQTVAITDATQGAVIYFTIDGSTPTTGANLYSGPITVSSTTTVKAIAVAVGYQQSPVASAAYVINGPIVPDFNLAPPSSTLTLTPGQPATGALSVSSMGGFTGTVTFTCTVPSAMLEASCSATPVQITGNSSAVSTLTVSTTAPHQVSAALRHGPWKMPSYGFLFCAVVLVTGADKESWRKRLLLAALLALMIAGFVSCGGGGGGTTNSSTLSTKTDAGTPAGTYNLTVTATGGSDTHSITVPVTVQ